MTALTIARTDVPTRRQAVVARQGDDTRALARIRTRLLALNRGASKADIDDLNQLLADTIILRDMYKKHYWQVSGPAFCQLHLLFDEHFEGQLELVDAIAGRIRTLGGVTVAMAHDVAESTLIPRAPKGREDPSTQVFRLLRAHDIILDESRAMAREAFTCGDNRATDVIISDVIRTNKSQVWSLFMHIAQEPAWSRHPSPAIGDNRSPEGSRT